MRILEQASRASSIPHLEESVRKLSEETDLNLGKDQSIIDLSAKIVQSHNENELMKQEIALLSLNFSLELSNVKSELADVTERLDEVTQPISARQIASNADNAAINAIFPEWRNKPYNLRSYSSLLSFLSKPEFDRFTEPLAPAAWLALTEEERVKIKSKADKFAVDNPYIKISIETLKSEASRQAYGTATVDETINFYKQQGDEEAFEAVSECDKFLGLTSTMTHHRRQST